MKRSKLFLVTGAAILVIATAFAAKVNKKFVFITTAYVHGFPFYVVVPTGVLTSSGVGLKTAYISILTAQRLGPIRAYLVTKLSKTHKVLFK